MVDDHGHGENQLAANDGRIAPLHDYTGSQSCREYEARDQDERSGDGSYAIQSVTCAVTRLPLGFRL